MNKWLKRTVAAVAGVAVLGGASLAFGAWLGERKSQRVIDIAVAPVAIPEDAASIERGRYLFASRGCVECHGADGAGREFVNDGQGLRLKAPNISPGPGSVVAAYTAQDWVRTIRHGVKPDRQPAFVMPSEDYARLTDEDLGALIAWLRHMPPAAGERLVAEVPTLVMALYGIGLLQDAAEKIDHRLPPAQAVPAGVNAQHGAYVANMCIGCHGEHLSGGKIPGTPPDWPPAANLTPGEGSALAAYPDAASFVAMLRSGRRPDGSAISTVMPFSSLRELNDTDAQALYLHLKALPPVAFGKR
jgi:cytochrome c553